MVVVVVALAAAAAPPAAAAAGRPLLFRFRLGVNGALPPSRSHPLPEAAYSDLLHRIRCALILYWRMRVTFGRWYPAFPPGTGAGIADVATGMAADC